MKTSGSNTHTSPVVFLHPRRMAKAYRADALSAVYRSALAERGLDSVRIDVLMPKPLGQAAMLERLTKRLATLGARVAVLEHGFSEPFLTAVRAGGVRHVVALGRPSERERPGIDLALPPSPLAASAAVSSASFCETIAALLDDKRADKLVVTPFVVAKELQSTPPRWDGEELIADAAELGEARTWSSGSLLVDLGCPYRRQGRRPAALQGVTLPPHCPDSGCSFCERPGPEPIAVAQRISLALDQLEHLAKARPELQRVQVVDESFLGYLDRFASALRERDLPPRDLLFSARPDTLLQQRGRLERALGILDGRHRLVLFCLGVENFSARELALFNKGFSPTQALAGLEVVDALQRDYPSFAVEASFGFILMNPWTRLEDLLINWKRMRAVGFTRYREGVLHSRLRLYPEIPLYHRALAEGLLRGETRRGGIDYGYGDADYRFVDPSVQRIHDQIAARGLGGDDLAGLGVLCREEMAARRTRA
jgi:hypothetical protein